MPEKKKEYYSTVFFLSFVIMIIVFVPMIIFGGGKFIYYSDYNTQEIGFVSNLQQAIRNGGLGWDWFTDIGTSHIASYSFYQLGSPFFWLMTIIPVSLLNVAMPVMLALKTAVAALTSYAYIKRFTQKNESAVVGALIYAFSGFQLHNIIFYHFHDAVAFFPLLLIAVEIAVKENKFGRFAPIVALCALTNYYFFFGQVIFLVIYAVIRSTDKSFGLTLKKLMKLLAEGVIGTLTACVLLFPNFISLCGNARAGIKIPFSEMFVFSLKFYARFLQMTVMSPDPCPISNLIHVNESTGSLSLFLPLCSVVFVVAYIMRKPKSWQSIITIVCIVIACIPVLNSAFSLFSAGYYARWIYMPLLIMCMMSAKVVDEPAEYKPKIPYFVVVGLFVLFAVCAFIPINGKQLIDKMDVQLFVAQIMISAFSYIILALVVFHFNKEKLFQLNCISAVAVSVIVAACGFVWTATSLSTDSDKMIANVSHNDADKLKDGTFFRTYLSYPNINYCMNYQIPSSQSYISTVNESIYEFYASIGIVRGVSSSYNNSMICLNGVFSVRYIFDRDAPSDISLTDKTGLATANTGFVYKEKIGDFYVYENQYFVPMGFTYDKYITWEDYNTLSGTQKTSALLKAIVLTNDQIESFGTDMEMLSISNLDTSTTAYIFDCEKLAETSCSVFSADSSGFTAKITLEEPELVFFSVPYDEGFTAYVNGEETEIQKVSGGLSAVYCQTGENDITFEFHTQGLSTGLALSVMGVAAYAGYIILALRKKKQ